MANEEMAGRDDGRADRFMHAASSETPGAAPPDARRRRWHHGTGLAALAAGALVACGGGELLLAAVISPLNGTWLLAGNPVGESLNFRTSLDVHLYNNRYDIAGSLVDPADSCGAPANGTVNLEGSFDNGEVVMRAVDAPGKPVCLSGRFSSLIRFEANALGTRGARFYQNTRVDVQMAEGLWVSEGGSLRLKFSDVISVNNEQRGVPIQACDVSPGVSPAVVMTGSMDGFLKATQTRPRIATLTVAGQSTARLRDVEFVDGGTIQLRNAAGATVKLTRQRESVPTFCPAP